MILREAIKKNLQAFKEYARFLGLNSTLRKKEYGYVDKKEFAEKHGVTYKTLLYWERKSEFREALRHNMNEWILNKTPDAIALLWNSLIQNPKSSNFKLWFKLAENAERRFGDDSIINIFKKDIQKK